MSYSNNLQMEYKFEHFDNEALISDNVYIYQIVIFCI